VWIPPSELRDQRELLRLRLFLVRFTASGTLKCENVTVVEKKSELLNLPAGYVISAQDEADAEDEEVVELQS
jgi:hypothetical protein